MLNCILCLTAKGTGTATTTSPSPSRRALNIKITIKCEPKLKRVGGGWLRRVFTNYIFKSFKRTPPKSMLIILYFKRHTKEQQAKAWQR